MPQRFADVYVFCLLKHRDQNTIDPLDVNQWEFYVLSTARLDRECANRRTIALGPLRELAGVPLNYANSMAPSGGRASRPEPPEWARLKAGLRSFEHGSLHVFSRSGRSISRRFARGYSGRNPSSPS